MDYKSLIRDVPDFPVEGIIFKDLTTLWKDPSAFKKSIDDLAKLYKGEKIDKIVAPESRGFILGAPLAYLLGAGFVPVRKAGKLPAEKMSITYELEYGQATIEIHRDAISEGEKVLVIDDLLATGGTTRAIVNLVRQLGGDVIGAGYLVELSFLNGREHLDVPVKSLIVY